MKCYFVAQIKINNQKEYQKYLDKVDEVFSKYKGKYLAVDNSPCRLEGKWDYSKSVIIEFPSKSDFESWYFSKEYQTILYSSIIVFIIPSLAIIFHSGLTLSIALVLYIGFKISIHGETSVLRKLFGEEYDKYEKSVNELFPFPIYLFPGMSIKR